MSTIGAAPNGILTAFEFGHAPCSKAAESKKKVWTVHSLGAMNE